MHGLREWVLALDAKDGATDGTADDANEDNASARRDGGGGPAAQRRKGESEGRDGVGVAESEGGCA